MSSAGEQRSIYFFGNGTADASNDLKEFVGGKGASLAEMTSAGFNVPPGFTISAQCCKQFFEAGKRLPANLKEAIRSGISRLEQQTGQSFGADVNPLLVAVRSGAAVSMPGMMDTILNVGAKSQEDAFAELFQAVGNVFTSWESERAAAYRKRHKIDDLLGTAVTVQAMCASEVSGVLFTSHPVSLDADKIVIESHFGLGEALVSGKVTPDQFEIDKESGAVVRRKLANNRNRPSLNDEQIRELCELGRRVEEFFATPCDIEWAIMRDTVYLLQSRAIKGLNESEREVESLRQEEIARLRGLANRDGTVWSRYNLAEILAQPTPMTWAIVRQFMSGKGGFGRMYRDLGFDPDPALDDVGVFDLICGRPYCNLSREPKMQYRQLPFEHPFEKLKNNPRSALYPAATFNPSKAHWTFWLLIPVIFFKLFRSALLLKRISRDFASTFVEEILPRFLEEVEQQSKADLQKLSNPELLELLRYWTKRTLFDFGRHSLKPTALAGIAMGNLERTLTRLLAASGGQAEPSETAREIVRELVMGVSPNRATDLAGGIRNFTQGKIDQQTFLQNFGHRGEQEMELSNPCWMEEPEKLEDWQQSYNPPFTAGTTAAGTTATTSPLSRLDLSPTQQTALQNEVDELHQFLRLRETAKHHLMRGYFLIRKILLEFDRRLQMNGGVFFLTPEELPELLAGNDFSETISSRRRLRERLSTILVPSVVFSDDLEAVGRPQDPGDATTLRGMPLSSGTAEGPALVLTSPTGTIPSDNSYVLVCPSTDPAWMPLFVRAQGIVMETGGMLSHGAIVARELNLPAVAGLPGIHQRVKTGQHIRIDGRTGDVILLD